MRERIVWIDCVKGMSIILVVLFHSVDWVEETTRIIEIINETMRPIRMPTFFLASGIVTSFLLQKDLRSYMKRRAVPLLYTLVVWTLVMFLLSHLLPWPTPMPLESLANLFIRPFNVLWFVLDLLLFSIAVRLLAKYPVATLAAAAVYSALFWNYRTENDNLAVHGFCYFVFFAAGAYYQPLIRRLLEPRPLAIALGSAALWLVIVLSPLHYKTFVTAVVGIAGFASVLILVSRTPLAKPLEYAGSNSVSIFLLHNVVMTNVAYFVPLPWTGLAGTLGLTALGVTVPVLARRWLPEALFTPPRAAVRVPAS